MEDGVAYNCDHACLEALQRMRDSWGCRCRRSASRLHVCSTARARFAACRRLHVACRMVHAVRQPWRVNCHPNGCQGHAGKSLPETPGRATKQITKCISLEISRYEPGWHAYDLVCPYDGECVFSNPRIHRSSCSQSTDCKWQRHSALLAFVRVSCRASNGPDLLIRHVSSIWYA